MKRRFLTITMIGLLSATMLCACGKEPASGAASTEATESVSESVPDGGGVSLDAADATARPQTETEADDFSEVSGNTAETETKVSESKDSEPAATEKPETVKFRIIQNARDKMFTLTNTEKQTLIIDAESDAGYTGTMKPKAGEYVTGEAGYYDLPYSSTLTLSDMDDEIVYVSAEYPNMISVAVQNAATVVLSDDRSVTITSKDDSSVFDYRVWMPSAGVKKESANEVLTGKGSGTLKIYWKDSKIAVEQLTPANASNMDTEDSDVAAVDWRTACPWADKIATGTWSDGADLSNVEQLKEGIMAAKFTPVTEITEEAKVVNLTFYDTDKNKLGVLRFWQKGNHVEVDGRSFDYDTFGLD